jgi:hypothetical protein
MAPQWQKLGDYRERNTRAWEVPTPTRKGTVRPANRGCGQLRERGRTRGKGITGRGVVQSHGETFRPLITVHAGLDPTHDATDRPTDRPRIKRVDSLKSGGVPCPLPHSSLTPTDERWSPSMKNEPRKVRKPSKCRTCSKDLRINQLMRFMPLNAKPGQVEYWVHAECAG